ncbi:MAG: dTDP-4-dehydrorhamnose reductase [Acidobacteriota bacterium]
MQCSRRAVLPPGSIGGYNCDVPARVLITGATGVLGFHLYRRWREDDGVRLMVAVRPGTPELPGAIRLEMDLAEPDEVATVLRGEEFDLVVHAAALTNPDECERKPALAQRVNVEATGRLLEALAPTARVVYISTDLVFDGTCGRYTEEDPVNPVNWYGMTKVAAEELVLARPNGVVVRVSKLFSWGSPFHPCFGNWLEEGFHRGTPVPLFADQYRTPLYVLDAVSALERFLTLHPRHAVYHLGGRERMNRYEFGRYFAEALGYSADAIRPIRMQEAGLAPRGADCSLVSDRFCGEFGFAPRPVREALRDLATRPNWWRDGCPEIPVSSAGAGGSR